MIRAEGGSFMREAFFSGYLGMIRAEGSFMREAVFSVLSDLGIRTFGAFEVNRTKNQWAKNTAPAGAVLFAHLKPNIGTKIRLPREPSFWPI